MSKCRSVIIGKRSVEQKIIVRGKKCPRKKCQKMPEGRATSEDEKRNRVNNELLSRSKGNGGHEEAQKH